MPQQQRQGQLVTVAMGLLAVLIFVGIARAVAHTPARAKNTTPIAPAATVSTMPTATPTPVVPALAVQGTQFVNAQGQTVTLVGATRQSLEYLCSGDGHFNLADFQAMRAWGMNVVRITLSSEFWGGAGGFCPNYHQTVAEAVNNAEAAGLYVILALQWDAPFDTSHDRTNGGVQCPMPDDQKDVAMWRDLATIYHSDQRVLFDLFSEPHDVSWNMWLNGGIITNAQCYIIGQQSNAIEYGTYQAIGMRDLVALVRSITPYTILIVGGLSWGYDLSGLDQGYALSGSNIVYSTHPFNYATKQPANWQNDFGDAAQHFPVIADEFGSYDCGTSYIGAAIAYFNAHHISWLAWAWNVGGCGGPSLLADWSGTPSQPYGAFLRQQMMAIKP